MKHSDLVVRASRWLRNTKNCVVVYVEMANVTSEIPDAIGWNNGHSILVECKASRSDFLADRRKPGCRDETCGMGRRRYYLVPAGLVRADEVPAWCGLLYCHPRQVTVEREAPCRDAWDRAQEVALLVSANRRHILGVRLSPEGRWETIEERDERRRLEAAAPEGFR